MEPMLWLLAVLFLVVPFLELAVIVGAADAIGLGPTLLLLVAVSVAGGYLMKYEGVGVVRRIQAQLDRGEIPTTELVNGALIVFAGALLLTPGFLTDILGIVLLVPPTRALVRKVLVARLTTKALAAVGPLGPAGGPVPGAGWMGRPAGGRRADVVDVDEVTPRHHEPGPLGPRELGDT